MPAVDRYSLLHPLDEIRRGIEELLPSIDPALEIYPGWIIKDILAHMTGWDDATIESLRAHAAGRPPAFKAIRSLDAYNRLTVSSREHLDYGQVLKEWRLARQVLHTLIEQLPDGKFIEPVIVPWGGMVTVTKLVEIFRSHEQEHADDIRKWLDHPDHPLTKKGN